LRIKFEHINYLAYLLFFFFLYFGGRMTLNALAILLLVQLFALFKRGTKTWKEFNKLLLIPVGFYLLHIASLVGSEDKSTGLFDLEVKMSLIIFPFLFGFQKESSKSHLTQLLLLFSMASALGGLFLLGNGLIQKIQTGFFPTYSSFSPNLHVSYLSAYATLNLVFCSKLLQKHQLKNWRIPLIISLLITLPIVAFAQSKAGMVIYALVASILVFQIILRFNHWIASGSLLVLVVSASLFIASNARFKAMILAAKDYDKHLSGELQTGESTADRLMTWNASLQLIKENLWMGLGNGDVRNELENRYRKLNYIKPAELHLNAHNQYFETFLYMGILGFLYLLYLMFTPLILKEEAYRFLLIIFGLHFLFESMFNTQAGIIFFVFWYVILINNHTKTKLIN
jgi:O-antigen ligase